MGILRPITEWATSPWGQNVPIHVAWFLIWVAAIAGLLFLIVHSIYVRYFAKPEEFAGGVSPTLQVLLPKRIPRHSLAARLFHWIMAAAMFTLLFTAFLRKVGVQFNWVTWHWIAGMVLTVSILFHIIHASLWLDFWAIWPDREDLVDASRRLRRFLGQSAPPPRRFAKYPLENKLYHGAIIATGLSAIGTGVFMLFRVRTGLFPRSGKRQRARLRAAARAVDFGAYGDERNSLVVFLLLRRPRCRRRPADRCP
jgi:formate dehydrogenase subunit gamma